MRCRLVNDGRGRPAGTIGDMAKRPGRPRLDPSAPSCDIHLRVSPKQYDQVYQDAAKARVSVSELIRRRLRRVNDDEDDTSRE